MTTQQPNNETGVQAQYKNWFLTYASYVILERAVPAIEDGLKPVQRRILHAMKEMDDGRYNKVAKIIGQAMQYHPHGDASIEDALVNLGQKDLLIDTQGNWGDMRTGDAAAAARYIEARPSKFALDVAFNPKTTQWQPSYDGRKNEPITLPIKFPLLLAQGAEGIAVGLATKILPHNFCEIIQAAINHIKGKQFELYPDFPTGGMIDISHYNQGNRGGKIKIRTHIQEIDKKTLHIKNTPYGITTTQLIDSIIKANDQGKIKIKKLTDNTAQQVEIQIDLAPGISTAATINALYAFTDCETTISPNTCVINNHKPQFISVNQLLITSAQQTKELLKQELQIKLAELQAKHHYTTLEKIFFEEKIYQQLEQKHHTWQAALNAINKAFNPFKNNLQQPITQQDIIKLTEKPVRRIYKLDIEELQNQITTIQNHIQQTQHHLNNLAQYTINYYQDLLKKYGKGKERKTEIKLFNTIQPKQATITNTKLYINRTEGFIGTSLKKDELLCECSSLDDIITFTKQGTVKVIKITDKTFVGKNIIHAAIFQKNDNQTTYNIIYTQGATGISYAKRFHITNITRHKEYHLIPQHPNSKIHYFSANPNTQTETLKIILNPNTTARNKEIHFDFSKIHTKAKNAIGNQVTKHPIKTIKPNPNPIQQPEQTTQQQKKLF